MNALLQAALQYAERGLRVLPLYEVSNGACACRDGAHCSRPGKHPRVRDGVNEATTDAQQLRNWWTRWPQANVGIATGRESDLVVVDADASDNKPGVFNLTALAGPNGGLPTTARVNTGGGG